MPIKDVSWSDDVRIQRYAGGGYITISAVSVLEFIDHINTVGRCQERVPDHTDFRDCGKIAVVNSGSKRYCSQHGSKRLTEAYNFIDLVVQTVNRNPNG